MVEEWIQIIEAIASVATAVGVFLAGWQIKLAKEQARTQFEDDMTRQYREILERIPVEALLAGKDEGLDEEAYKAALHGLYRYIHLSNEQVFLRQHSRVSTDTWRTWCVGIEAHLSRPAFRRAWEEIKQRAHDDFAELRRLEEGGFREDPRDWKARNGSVFPDRPGGPPSTPKQELPQG